MPFWIDDLNARKRQGLLRTRRWPRSAQGPRLHLKGREVLNFSSNDYLNLAADPRLARAASRAAHRYGCGAGSSPLISGCLPPLRLLERDLAAWEGTATALVFSSGFTANLALVAALAGREDVIFSDALNHASLIDGCRLSRARVHVYRHRDANHLADLLAQEGPPARRRVIVSDTVFSMDGDLAPLPDLYDLALRHDALLLLDEAHATGILGPQGRGAVELFPPPANLHEDAVIRVATLSKALGAQGGFTCGSRPFVAWLVNHARPYVFSTALAPPTAAAARAALRLVREEPERRQHLLTLASRLRERLAPLLPPPDGPVCPIVPVVVGEARVAVRLSGALEERGLLVPAIRPPSVPEGTARLRISLSAGHRMDEVDRLADSLLDLRIEAARVPNPLSQA